MSNPHRALQIPDVLEIIIDHLNTSDIARLCRTCSVFNGPATERLWRHGTTASFKALTGMWITDYENSDLPGRLTLARNWRRFQMYSEHVRTLDLMNTTLPKREDGERDECEVGDLLAALAVFGRQAPLLPHLRHLSFHAKEPHDLAGVLLFLGPELDHIELIANPPDEENTEKDWAIPIGCLLELAPIRAPRLTELGLGFKISSRHLDALADTLEKMQLTALGAETLVLDRNVFCHLAASKTLKALQIGAITFDKLGTEPVHDDPDLTIDFSCVTPWSFPALKTLQIHESVWVIQGLLDVLRTELDELCLRFYPEELFTDRQLSQICGTIRDHHRGLLKLELCFRDRDPRAPLHWSTFSPLLSCRNMIHFTFNYFSPSTLILADQDMLELSVAWPNLRKLEIDWLRRHGSAFGLAREEDFTLNALAYLAANCRSLRLLVLESFDCTSVPPPPPSLSPCTHPFELRVGRTTNNFDSVKVLAAWLVSIWPKIVVVPLDRWSDEQQHFWGTVSEMAEVVRVMRVIRAEKEREGSGDGKNASSAVLKRQEGWYDTYAIEAMRS
ncbi:hypothetical protein DACRYDRAFT_21711 [Dacryopinax primogenitus]|uniref:F-box domain-containing protein n=1 Tax=Dacryopinax primogenitus (strain DJM 731) TaxID=1858805 RepID=M5G9Z7_DACPD|nr:uncharacterized protein DACRYDRAFT_21711 [Dacryopinax primogenitus]EJU02717.1 hypothetical protein DACRYDRAFT_21711 [Dacryopinax primogenitus]